MKLLLSIVSLAGLACSGGALQAALITSFTPSQGPRGTVVTLNGSGFTGTTNAYAVALPQADLEAAPFQVLSDSQTQFTIPATLNPPVPFPFTRPLAFILVNPGTSTVTLPSDVLQISTTVGGFLAGSNFYWIRSGGSAHGQGSEVVFVDSGGSYIGGASNAVFVKNGGTAQVNGGGNTVFYEAGASFSFDSGSGGNVSYLVNDLQPSFVALEFKYSSAAPESSIFVLCAIGLLSVGFQRRKFTRRA